MGTAHKPILSDKQETIHMYFTEKPRFSQDFHPLISLEQDGFT
nr:MAG TPA: hypothetical protein [Herelleviridae sp.]